MDQKPTDLKAALRELAAEEAGGAAPHVGLKRLIAYRQGTLAAAEREAVQEHLSLCPRCTRLWRELRDFAAAAVGGETGPEALRQEAWSSLVRRLPEKTSVVRPITGAARGGVRRRLVPPVAAAAAALLLAIAGLAAWAAVTVLRERPRLARLEQRLTDRDTAVAALQRSLAEAERQLAAARRQIRDLETTASHRQPASRVDELESRVAELTATVTELRRAARTPDGREPLQAASRALAVSVAPRFVLRGQETSDSGFLRAGGVVNPVRLQADRFTVALSLADQPVYGEYRLELLDREGKVIWAAHRPDSALRGDAGTTVAIGGLGPGLYRLRIEGLHPDRSDLLAEYVLDVRPG